MKAFDECDPKEAFAELRRIIERELKPLRERLLEKQKLLDQLPPDKRLPTETVLIPLFPDRPMTKEQEEFWYESIKQRRFKSVEHYEAFLNGNSESIPKYIAPGEINPEWESAHYELSLSIRPQYTIKT